MFLLWIFYLFSASGTKKKKGKANPKGLMFLFWISLYSCILWSLFRFCGRHRKLGHSISFTRDSWFSQQSLSYHYLTTTSNHDVGTNNSNNTHMHRKENKLLEVFCLWLIHTNFRNRELKQNEEPNSYLWDVACWIHP
jgi:hypothetical protein